MQNHVIFMLSLAAALTTAWSIAPVEEPTIVDTDMFKLAQGLRTPTETSVCNPVELKEALADGSVDAILMLDGYYNLTATLKISRTVSIRAKEARKAVLNGQGKVRVLDIVTSGTVTLVGLQITGGYTPTVRLARD